MRITLPVFAAGLCLGLVSACSGTPAPPPPDAPPPGGVHGARGANVPDTLRGAPARAYDTTVARHPPTDIRPLPVQQAEANNPL